MQHANVVQIYEVGEQDGQPYLSLEFVAVAAATGCPSKKFPSLCPPHSETAMDLEKRSPGRKADRG